MNQLKLRKQIKNGRHYDNLMQFTFKSLHTREDGKTIKSLNFFLPLSLKSLEMNTSITFKIIPFSSF